MRRRIGRAFAYVVLIMLGLAGIAPIIYLAVLSTKKRIEILAQVPPTLDFKWSRITKNYNEVLFSQGMLEFTVNSIIVVGATTVLVLVIATPAAYAFSRFRFRGNENLAFTILSMRFMPPVAIAIPLFLMMQWVGTHDSYLGLILPYIAFSLPLVVWIMIGFFDEIPQEIVDAAIMDGCTRFEVLWRVMLPMVRPGLVTGVAVRCDLHLERVSGCALRNRLSGIPDDLAGRRHAWSARSGRSTGTSQPRWVWSRSCRS